MFGLSGMDGTAWYMMDLEQMLQGSGMDLQTLLESTSQQDSYEAVVVSMIDGLPVTDALTCATMLESLNPVSYTHLAPSSARICCTVW